MIRHIYKCMKNKTVSLKCFIDALSQLTFPDLTNQKTPLLITRKSQMMDVANNVKMANTLVMQCAHPLSLCPFRMHCRMN